jgi:hypothetical protein
LNFKLFSEIVAVQKSQNAAPVSNTPASQPGSIVRLKFINFMQYKDTAFNCGPNLNVIIGFNGSGKSTIVNGICLGLRGRPAYWAGPLASPTSSRLVRSRQRWRWSCSTPTKRRWSSAGSETSQGRGKGWVEGSGEAGCQVQDPGGQSLPVIAPGQGA